MKLWTKVAWAPLDDARKHAPDMPGERRRRRAALQINSHSTVNQTTGGSRAVATVSEHGVVQIWCTGLPQGSHGKDGAKNP